jgi:hypothetical protein
VFSQASSRGSDEKTTTVRTVDRKALVRSMPKLMGAFNPKQHAKASQKESSTKKPARSRAEKPAP